MPCLASAAALPTSDSRPLLPCSARVLQVYSEVYRVLKPGAIFMTYEWVTTPSYDPTNTAHVACVDEIIIGNGLPVGTTGGAGKPGADGCAVLCHAAPPACQ